MYIIIFSSIFFFTCQKKSSKGQAFRQNLQNLLDVNSNETSGDDAVNVSEEHVQKSARRKTEKQIGKALCAYYFPFRSFLHHKLC